VYVLSKGSVEEMKINIETKPVSMIRIDRSLVIAGMDSTLTSFNLKGKKNFSLLLPGQIVSLQCVQMIKG